MPGLAHFCEHLLFMGTEKYPDENHFENHVRRFGGYYNASTHEDFTRYYVSEYQKIMIHDLYYMTHIIRYDSYNTV